MSKTIGRAVDVEGRMRLQDRDRVAGRAGRDPQPGQPADGAQARPAGQQHALGVDRRRAAVSTPTTRAAAGGGHVRRPVKAVRSRSSTPAACIASE